MSEKIIKLRPLEKIDLEFLVELGNDPVVRENVVGWDWPLSLAAQEKWFENSLQNTSTKRFIIENENSKPIGITGLWEIDWHNRSAMTAIKLGGRNFQSGNGYATLAVATIMDFAFVEVGLNKLHGSILASNLASQALYLNKSGWSQEGLLKKHVWRNGVFQDLLQVAILKEEYTAWLQKATP